MFAVLSKPNDFAKRIIRGAYPEYRGRTVYVTSASRDGDAEFTATVRNYWDEGCRDYAKVVNRFTGQPVRIVPENHPYYGRSANGVANDGSVRFNGNECLVLHCYRGTRQHIQIILDESLVPLLGEYKAR